MDRHPPYEFKAITAAGVVIIIVFIKDRYRQRHVTCTSTFSPCIGVCEWRSAAKVLI
jgi:hypothetical protein